MAMGRRRFDFDGRVIIIFVVVAIPFVAVGAAVIVGLVRGALRESVGQSLAQHALETRVLIERYVAQQTVHVRLLALDPAVRATVSAPAKAPSAADAQKIEQAWAQGTDAQLIAPYLASPLAAYLRDAAQVQPAVKLLQVIDAGGHLVASSARGGRLQQSDTPWFKSFAAEGTHGAYVGDIHKLTGSDRAVLEIAYPIYHATEGQWLGAVRALIDASDLYGVLAPVRIGRTGHALLVRQDGMILSSDDPKDVLTRAYPGFDILQALRRESGAYRTLPQTSAKAGGAERTEAERVVGFADVEQVRDVAWTVLIQQDVAEAMAPVTDVTRYLWLHFLGAFSSFVVLALYLSVRMKQPVIGEELHLHEEHVPQSMRRRRTDRNDRPAPETPGQGN
jgi:hypothetical protein